MGFFNNILEKLGLRKKDEPAAKPPSFGSAGGGAKPKPAMDSKDRDDIIRDNLPPRVMAEVDVVKKLEDLSKGKDLNWKVSIVDLLKLLDIDSSREARNELATELGCPADLKDDSAKMNVWLHKAVLKKISENGGNIPASLLD